MSTATAPIRFRCFRCQKLLGVSKSKVGAVVACPQCSAELIVPEPAEIFETTPPPPSKSSSASRIEPVVVPWDAPPAPERMASAADVPFPAILIEPVTLRAESASKSRHQKPTPPTSNSTQSPDFAAIGISPPQTAAQAVPVTVAFALEAPSGQESGAPRGANPYTVRGLRRDDVVLPRSVITLWSFLVLLGFVFAFTAGLLIGRFVWASGITGKVPAGRSISALFERNSFESTRQPDCILLAREV